MRYEEPCMEVIEIEGEAATADIITQSGGLTPEPGGTGGSSDYSDLGF